MKPKVAKSSRKTASRHEPWSGVRARILTNPEVQFHYDALKIQEQVGAAVARARVAQGLTQAQLAIRARTSQPAIARLESGRGGIPSLDFLGRVAAAIGLQLTVGFRAGKAA